MNMGFILGRHLSRISVAKSQSRLRLYMSLHILTDFSLVNTLLTTETAHLIFAITSFIWEGTSKTGYFSSSTTLKFSSLFFSYEQCMQFFEGVIFATSPLLVDKE